MIYKKYEISKQEDVFTGKGFLYVVHSPNKDDYYHHAKTLQTCKKWIDENDFPVRPLTPARKAKLEKEKRRKKSEVTKKSKVGTTKRRKRIAKRRVKTDS
jgi:hypothetical protein